jgi:hypothetical protein
MKLLGYPILISVLLVVCPTPASAIDRSNPAAVASKFYRAYLKLKIREFPEEKQRKVLGPLLSSEPQKLLRAAKQKQEKFIGRTPWC